MLAYTSTAGDPDRKRTAVASGITPVCSGKIGANGMIGFDDAVDAARSVRVTLGRSAHCREMSTAHGTDRERQTKALLEQVCGAPDLDQYTFTRRGVIKAAMDARVSRADAKHRFAQSADELLSSYVHEQLHWHLRARGANQQEAIAELRRMYTGAPVGLPEGADTAVTPTATWSTAIWRSRPTAS